MLTQHISVNRASGHTTLLSKDTTKASTVKEGTATKNLVLWKTRELLSVVGQDIYRVGDQENDSVLAEGLHVLNC